MEIWWDRRREDEEEEGDALEVPSIYRADRWIVSSDVSENNNNNNSEATTTTTPEIFWLHENELWNANNDGGGDSVVVGAVVHLNNPSDQEQALSVLGSVEWLWIIIGSESGDNNNDNSWKMIPAENIIAAAQSTGTKVAFSVASAADVSGLVGALELGVDALCLSTTPNNNNNTDLWDTAFRAREERNTAQPAKEASSKDDPTTSTTGPEIVKGTCWRRDTRGTVLADRICVDLVQRLAPSEGCWIGSSAKVLALVGSEAAASKFVPKRPFRVNAGPVHSYILLGDGITTKYLCELRPSDKVLVHNAETHTSKQVAVGRLKEEIRPCVLIELRADNGDGSGDGVVRGQVFLQQAETVRLGQPSGRFVRVTDLQARSGTGEDGDTNNDDLPDREPVLLRCTTTGTHVGKTYSGKVEER